MSENNMSRLRGNANKKTKKWRYFIYGVIKKNSWKELNKIEARLAKRK